MRTLILTSAALAMAAAAPAFAYNNTPAGPQMNNQQSFDQNQQTPSQTFVVRQHITNELSKAGFTDIKVMPQSFFVRARDSAGFPVMMVISPQGITAVTQMRGQGQNGQSSQNNGQYGQNGWHNNNNGQSGQNNNNNNNGQFGQNGTWNNHNGQYSQNGEYGQNHENRYETKEFNQNGGAMGSSGLNNSADSGNAINSPNGNGTPVR